jgi:hypothetical protein
VITENPIISVTYLPEAVGGDTYGRSMPSSMMEGREGMSRGGLVGDSTVPEPKIWKLRRYDFTIQFFWKETPRSARQEKPAGEAGEEAIDTAAVGDEAGPTG